MASPPTPELQPFIAAIGRRPRDLEDVVGVVRRSGDRLDWRYIDQWVADFAQLPGREDMTRLLGDIRRETNRR